MKFSIADLRMLSQRDGWDWPAATHTLSTKVTIGSNGNSYFAGWNRNNPGGHIRYQIFQYDPHRKTFGIVRTGTITSANEAKRMMKILSNSLPDEIRTDPYIQSEARAYL